VGGECRADNRAGAGDEVGDPGRQACFVDRVEERVGHERREFGRLQHDRAASRQRQTHLGHNLVQRVVPRGDRADHAHRFADHGRVADGLVGWPMFRVLGGAGQYGQRKSGLDPGGDGHRRADLQRDRGRDLLRSPGQRLVQPSQMGRPLLRCQSGPRLERHACRRHRTVHVRYLAGRHGGDHPLRGWVLDVDGAGASRGYPLAVDVELGTAARYEIHR
jgi:hypothetical protein